MCDFYKQRCDLFVEEVGGFSTVDTPSIYSVTELHELDKARLKMEGDEKTVRSRQSFCTNFSVNDLGKKLVQLKELYDKDIYLSWNIHTWVVKMRYMDFVSSMEVLDCVWQPYRDDVDIILPGLFLYSIDDSGGVWHIDLS